MIKSLVLFVPTYLLGGSGDGDDDGGGNDGTMMIMTPVLPAPAHALALHTKASQHH